MAFQLNTKFSKNNQKIFLYPPLIISPYSESERKCLLFKKRSNDIIELIIGKTSKKKQDKRPTLSSFMGKYQIYGEIISKSDILKRCF